MTRESIDPDTTTSVSTKRSSTKRPLRQRLSWLGLGLMLGAVIILGIRFVIYHPADTHYHANFAVYIDGQRETFKSPQYYEEVKLCDLHGSTPQSRVHMHDEENGVVHVHAPAVTWGAFFENLGWYVGPDFIRTPTAMYQTNDANKLNIVLNGQNLTGLSVITNQVINDKDRLLISYGPADQSVLDTEYKTVPNTAAQYDAKKDPASCGGSESPTVSDRLHHLF